MADFEENGVVNDKNYQKSRDFLLDHFLSTKYFRE